MASDDFPLINDPHAQTRHPDAESVNGGDYYTSYADSDQEKSGSGAPVTPSSKRNHQNQQHNYYYNNSNKKHKSNSNNIETEANINATADYRADYRKDREEWSDTAISCLLEAYTEKYNQLNRGNLRGRDWEEVAEAVSERGGGNNKKSVEQCKNKIDNLKKRYKVELQRTNNSNNGGFGSNGISSSWHWFKQIEAIIGNSSNAKAGGGGESECGVGGSGGNCNLVTKPVKRLYLYIYIFLQLSLMKSALGN